MSEKAATLHEAIHHSTTVGPGGRVEVTDARLPSGTAVEVFVLRSNRDRTATAVEILARAPGRRLFKTAEEVDAYLHAERTAWES